MVKDPSSKYSQASGDEGMVLSNSSTFLNGEGLKTETPNVKKRHRRMKSSGVKNSEVDGKSPKHIVSFSSVSNDSLLLRLYKLQIQMAMSST